MTAISFIDNVGFVPTAGGTADWTFSSAVGSYQSFAAAGAVNGATYRYRAQTSDLTQWEIGTGVYNSSTGVLTRAAVLYNSSGTGTAPGQSGAGTKISFTTVPLVVILILAEDFVVTTAAAKSDQQAATSAALAVTPAHQQDHDSAAKAWVTFNAAGTILASYNVSSVSKLGTGVYTINFTAPFASANYVCQVGADSTSTVFTAQPQAKTTSSIGVATFAAGAVADATTVDVVCYGRQ